MNVLYLFDSVCSCLTHNQQTHAANYRCVPAQDIVPHHPCVNVATKRQQIRSAPATLKSQRCNIRVPFKTRASQCQQISFLYDWYAVSLCWAYFSECWKSILVLKLASPLVEPWRVRLPRLPCWTNWSGVCIIASFFAWMKGLCTAWAAALHHCSSVSIWTQGSSNKRCSNTEKRLGHFVSQVYPPFFLKQSTPKAWLLGSRRWRNRPCGIA